MDGAPILEVVIWIVVESDVYKIKNLKRLNIYIGKNCKQVCAWVTQLSVSKKI